MHDDGASPPRTVVSRLTAILLTFRYGSVHSLTEIAALTGCRCRRFTGWPRNWRPGNCSGARRTAATRSAPTSSSWPGTIHHRPDLDERATLVVCDLSDVTRRRARLGIL